MLILQFIQPYSKTLWWNGLPAASVTSSHISRVECFALLNTHKYLSWKGQ